MRGIQIKSSLATLAVAAAALGAAGPASASDSSLQNALISGFVESQHVPAAVVAGRYGDGKLAGVRGCFMDYTDDSCMG
jgi:hypothetical protein